MFRNHVCLTFPLASINLYDLIKRNHFKGLSLRLIRRFTQQIVTGLAFLHIQGVCHADMKPENVLLRHPNRSGVDIIDLGSSLFEGQIVYTYIQVGGRAHARRRKSMRALPLPISPLPPARCRRRADSIAPPRS